MENPAETYLGTIWELLPGNKFLKTGATPLQQAGSNSINITKANLPAEKLQVESFSLTRGTMEISGRFSALTDKAGSTSNNPFYYGSAAGGGFMGGPGKEYYVNFQASRSWTGNTSSATPYTNVMGNGTPITINPEYITVKAWKRLT